MCIETNIRKLGLVKLGIVHAAASRVPFALQETDRKSTRQYECAMLPA